jgi:hypothetical protein
MLEIPHANAVSLRRDTDTHHTPLVPVQIRLLFRDAPILRPTTLGGKSESDDYHADMMTQSFRHLPHFHEN